MKKKNMTRAARQGHEYQIVLDLAGSLFYSQEQCFRTKMVLMKDGQVELDENENKEILEYKKLALDAFNECNAHRSFRSVAEKIVTLLETFDERLADYENPEPQEEESKD